MVNPANQLRRITVRGSRTQSGLPRRRAMPMMAFGLVMALTACSASTTPGASTGSPAATAAGLSQSSAGVCAAIAALPDAAAAEHAFDNSAHEALHGLAADPRLDRIASAAVLESMERVESDFAEPSGTQALAADLATLLEVANRALRAIGEAAPACP
jgi:hypothetical protein